MIMHMHHITYKAYLREQVLGEVPGETGGPERLPPTKKKDLKPKKEKPGRMSVPSFRTST